MRTLTNAEIEEVTEGFILANTPGFLLARLLKSQLVYRWVEEATEAELVEIYQNSSRGDPTDANIAVAYAALVAILVKRREACESFDIPLELDRLHWGQKIVEIASRTAHFTTRQVLTVGVRPPTTMEQGQLISVSTTSELRAAVKARSPQISNTDGSAGSPEGLPITDLNED